MTRNTVDTAADGFWMILARMYHTRDKILDSSNSIVDYAYQIEAIVDKTSPAAYLKKDYDWSKLKGIFAEILKATNSILSDMNELRPHLQNPDSVSIFNSTVLTLNLQMSMPTSILGFKLKEIAIATKLVAQSANRLVLNPTKKSIKAAFGIEIGNEWAKIKAYIERNYTNY